MQEKVDPEADTKSWIRLQPVHSEKELLKDKYIFTFLTDVSKTDAGGLWRCWNIVSALCDSKQQCRWHNSQLNCRAQINSFKNMKHVRLQKQAKPQQRVTNLPNKPVILWLHHPSWKRDYTEILSLIHGKNKKSIMWSVETYLAT